MRRKFEKEFKKFLCFIGFHHWKSVIRHKLDDGSIVLKVTCHDCPHLDYIIF